MAILIMDWYKPSVDMDKRLFWANCSSTDHHVSVCRIYKKGMKPIGFGLEDEVASEIDHEYFMRRIIEKLGSRFSFATCRIILNWVVHCFRMRW